MPWCGMLLRPHKLKWKTLLSTKWSHFDKVKFLLISIVFKWLFLESVSGHRRYSIAIFQMSPSFEGEVSMGLPWRHACFANIRDKNLRWIDDELTSLRPYKSANEFSTHYEAQLKTDHFVCKNQVNVRITISKPWRTCYLQKLLKLFSASQLRLIGQEI